MKPPGQKSGHRRTLHFHQLDEIVADAEHALTRGYRAVGKWSLGQVASHLAILMELSLDGFPFQMPRSFQVMGRLLRPLFLRQSPPAGIKMPVQARGMLKPSDDVSDEAGVQRLREAVSRLHHESQRHPSPILGQLTKAQWDRFHCRHAELHLSFIVPHPDRDEP
jgi:hypothetical protein